MLTEVTGIKSLLAVGAERLEGLDPRFRFCFAYLVVGVNRARPRPITKCVWKHELARRRELTRHPGQGQEDDASYN